MARKRGTKVESENRTTVEKGDTPPPATVNRAIHRILNVRLDPQISAAFDAWRESMAIPPSVTHAVEYALSEFLRSQGFDPATYLGD